MSPKVGSKGGKGNNKGGKFNGKPGGKGGKPAGKVGKFNGKPAGKFGGKPAGKFTPNNGPQKKFAPKEIEEMSDESFDDSDAGDFMESDEGISEIPAKAGQKRGLKEINASPAKKQEAPKGKNVKKGKKEPEPSDEEDDSDAFDFENMMSGSDDEMDDEEMSGEEGSDMDDITDEEEDSLMGADSDEDDEEDDDEEDEEEAPVPVPSGVQLKLGGVSNKTNLKALTGFFGSKGFKNVEIVNNAAAGCLVLTVKNSAEAGKIKAAMKGATFQKNKISLLDFQAPAKAKQPKVPEALKGKDAKKSKKLAEDLSEEDFDSDEDFGDEEMDDEELSDEDLEDEMMSDEEMSGLESFDDEEEDDDDDVDAEVLKKATEKVKTNVKALEPTGPRVILRGVAKSFECAKIKKHFKEKKINVTSEVVWDAKQGGFVFQVGDSDLDKTLALRGTRMEKFNLSLKACDETAESKSEEKTVEAEPKKAEAEPKKATKAEEKKAESETKKAAKVEEKKVEQKEETGSSSVVLKGVPKAQADKLKQFFTNKKINVESVEFKPAAGGFAVVLKSKTDLDNLKKVKSEKVGGKFRFSITEEAVKPEAKKEAKKEEPKKEAKKEEPKKETKKEEAKKEAKKEEPKKETKKDTKKEEPKKEAKKEEPKKEAKKETKKATVESDEPKAKVQKTSGSETQLRLIGIPKATSPEKLVAFFKSRGISTASVKLIDSVIVATITDSSEAEKARAMNGVKFNAFNLRIENYTPGEKKTSATQSQFRARLLSIPSDFAVPKLTNLLVSRGVESVVVTKENGQYVANCSNKNEYQKLLSLKGQRVDDKVRLMIAPIAATPEKPAAKKTDESRKRPAEAEEKENSPAKAPKTENQDDRRSLYVGNLDPKTTDDEVRKHFSEAIKINIIRRKGVKKLFGFVTFDSEETCDLVKKNKSNVSIRGCKVNIDYCGSKSVKFSAIKGQTPENVEEKKVEKKADKKADKKVEKKETGKKEADTPKSKLKNAQSPSKNASVRFAADVKDNEPEDDEDDSDMESFDEDDSDMEAMSFDEDDMDSDDNEDDE